MTINVRKGKKEDLTDVLFMIKELAEYENSLHEEEITIEQLQKDGFGNKPYFSFLIASIEGKAIGFSFYFIRYSTWKGKFLFLEDFYIKEAYRNKGVGSILFQETINLCKELEVNGMMWQVLDWNTSAIDFYKKFNSNVSSDWLTGKLTKDQIKNLVQITKTYQK